MTKTLVPELETQVEGLGDIYTVYAPFDEALASFDNVNAERINVPMTGRDLAFARIQLGYNHSLTTNGRYIKEGNIYIPKETRILLVRDSAVLKDPIKAKNSHGKGKEFFVEGSQVSQYLDQLESSPDSPVIELKSTKSIPTNRFGQELTTLWLFEDQAAQYGQFLRDSSYDIKEVPLWFSDKAYIKSQEKPYANQLWLRRVVVDGGSYVSDDVRYFYYNNGVSGVFQKSGEASAQNFEAREEKRIESHTSTQLKKALKELKISGLEEQILSELRKH